MTPSEIRIGTVLRTVTTVTSGFELHADTEFFVNANYFGKILLVMISSSTTKNLSDSFCHLVRFNILTKTAPKKSPYQWTANFYIKFSKVLTEYSFLLLNDTVLTWLLEVQ